VMSKARQSSQCGRGASTFVAFRTLGVGARFFARSTKRA
jgi:hypothetical protein